MLSILRCLELTKCCSITISRSPAFKNNQHAPAEVHSLRRLTSYCIFVSSVAHNVSRGLPFGVMGSSEKMPIHLSPAKTRFLSSVLGQAVLEVTASVRSFSELDFDPRILAVASRHDIPLPEGLRKSIFSSERNPISTRTYEDIEPRLNQLQVLPLTLMNSGNPLYLKVPRITVSIIYKTGATKLSGANSRASGME